MPGRLGYGLLETLGPSLGISGASTNAAWSAPGIHPEMGRAFMRAYFRATGQNPDRTWTPKGAVAAIRHAFGLHAYK